MCIPCYNKLMGQEFLAVNGTQYQKLIVKLKNPQDASQRQQLYDSLWNNLSSFFRRYINLKDFYRNQKAR